MGASNLLEVVFTSFEVTEGSKQLAIYLSDLLTKDFESLRVTLLIGL